MMNIIEFLNLILTFMACSLIVAVILLVLLTIFFFLVFTGRLKLKYTSLQEKCNDVCPPRLHAEGLNHVLALNLDNALMKDAFLHFIVTEALRHHGKYLLSHDAIEDVKAQLSWNASKGWLRYQNPKANKNVQSEHVGEHP